MTLKVFMTSTTGFGMTDHQFKNIYTVEEVTYQREVAQCHCYDEEVCLGHCVVLRFLMASSNRVEAERWHRAFATFIARFGMTEIRDTDELLGKYCTLADIDRTTPVTVLTTEPDVLWAVSRNENCAMQ